MRMVRISEATLSPSINPPQTLVGPKPSEMLSARKKGLVKTRGEGVGGKARAVAPPHGDGVACPDADSCQLADYQRYGKLHILAYMPAPAHCSAVHETLPVNYAKAGGAMTSCQNPSDCGIA